MASDSVTPPTSFEAALGELERIVTQLEEGTTSLEEALAAYERGAQLLRYCQETLQRAEEKIRLLDDEQLRPLDLDARGDEGDSA